MASNAFVRARIDENIKDEAAAVLAQMGLTVSDVVRMTLTRVARDKALPFDMKVPNAETQTAMEESRAMMGVGKAHFRDAKDLFNALDQDTGKQ